MLNIAIVMFRWRKGGVTVGGVLCITPEMYTTANGYSNRYDGWGGEDNDFRIRFVDQVPWMIIYQL